MYRQSASRNQRSKGFKVKHVLQIGVLVAVCFWLIYQVKHSHDKKEFDHNDAKISQNMQRENEILKFGRKDLNPQVKEKTKENEKHDEEVEEEIGEEEEKHEEEQKEDHKTEKKEVEGRGGGDDEVDEHDQVKSDSDVDREEEFIDEEKEREEGDEKESDEKDVEDSDKLTENENSIEDQDHDGATRNTHEAREEQYKADDASSAVTHDGQTINTENENSSVENQVNIVEHENKGNNTEENNISQNTTDFKVQEVETAENGSSTVDQEKGSEVFDSTSQGSSSLNSTITSESNDKPESSNELTGGGNTEFHGISLKNGTDSIILDPSNAQNVTGSTISAEGSNFQTLALEQNDNSSVALDNSQFDSNLTTSNATENVQENTVESSNSSTSSYFVVSDNSTQSNLLAETKDGSESTITEVNTNAILNKKSDISGGTNRTYESSDSNNTENTDEVQHDTIDSSDSSVTLDDKGVHVDLDTLPYIRTEGSNSEEAAEE